MIKLCSKLVTRFRLATLVRRSRPGLIVVLFASAAASSGQEQSPAGVLPDEPICGFAAKHYYFDAAKVRRGLSVDLLVGEPEAGQPVTLRFFVSEKPRGAPVEGLLIEHQKFVHVIGVRDDLNEFFHIHPTKVGPGMWQVSHVFSKGGHYRIWSDLKYRGTVYTFTHPALSVSGSKGNADADRVPSDLDFVSGYQVRLKHPEPLTAGRTNQLAFEIRNSAGSIVETENFLGTPMHLVILRVDASVYLHAHPDMPHGAPSGPEVKFQQVFPEPGLYRLFAQFRPRKGKLPPDESLLAKFFVRVEKAGTTTAGR